ncbi:MAG: APC family permease [Armatimonadetes bacterium]|nr:APC family permease [Armatimonadota bacterium]
MKGDIGSRPFRRLRHVLFGSPIHAKKAHHERMGIVTGLPVFASDALSSSAYATEAILGVLILAGTQFVGLQIWFGLAIALLIAIVSWSYWQTIHAYPGGGGSYIVASENLGEKPGLVAGAALMIDYVLTVAVSVAAGVVALVSAFPALHEYLIVISWICIGLISYANLRGMRESGAVFAFPTYGFLVSVFVMLGFAAWRAATTTPVAQVVHGEPGAVGRDANVLFLFVVFRAFAAGCTALTGIEAVSDGVPAFRPPESRNASRTLLIMAVLLTALFLGIGFAVQRVPVLELFATKNPEYTTVLSQIASWAFGPEMKWAFYIVQFMTAAILILAANTAFADFPRLASFLARDGYLPRPLARQGDRLVFQNGIILLALASAILIWVYHGELDHLLPLYAVGVFLAFTLSQSGMVMHWKKLGERGHGLSMSVNMLGAVLTGAVTLVLLFTKFREGAWLIFVLTVFFYAVFRAIKNRYASINVQLERGMVPVKPLAAKTVLLLIPRVHRGVLSAVEYALALNAECRALHVTLNSKTVPELKEQWDKYVPDVPLIVVDSPYRSLIDPVLEYVDMMQAERPNLNVTVIVPEAVPTKWHHRFLQENLAFRLKFALGNRRNVVVTNVRYFLD